MKKKQFDIEKHEKEILEDFEKGDLVSIDKAPGEMLAAKQAASHYLKRENRVNIRKNLY